MNKVQSDLTDFEARFIEAAGEMAESLSIARSVGQIYALLYISEEPLALDEICAKLGISKGNGSTNLRVLEQWDAVTKAWVKGDRRAHYHAVPDLRRIALKRVDEGLRRRIAVARDRLSSIESAGAAEGLSKESTARLRELKAFLGTVEKGLALLPKLQGLSRLL